MEKVEEKSELAYKTKFAPIVFTTKTNIVEIENEVFREIEPIAKVNRDMIIKILTEDKERIKEAYKNGYKDGYKKGSEDKCKKEDQNESNG